MSAAIIAITSARLPCRSMIEVPQRTGGRSASPVMLMRPLCAWSARSLAPMCESGPLSPYDENSHRMMSGRTLHRSGCARPNFFIAPCRKLWTTMSHPAAMRSTARRPAGEARSIAMLRLLRLSATNDGLTPAWASSISLVTPKYRASSPRPGSSTLITSAPRSPRICVAAGPANTRDRSRMRTPASTFHIAASP